MNEMPDDVGMFLTWSDASKALGLVALIFLAGTLFLCWAAGELLDAVFGL